LLLPPCSLPQSHRRPLLKPKKSNRAILRIAPAAPFYPMTIKGNTSRKAGLDHSAPAPAARLPAVLKGGLPPLCSPRRMVRQTVFSTREAAEVPSADTRLRDLGIIAPGARQSCSAALIGAGSPFRDSLVDRHPFPSGKPHSTPAQCYLLVRARRVTTADTAAIEIKADLGRTSGSRRASASCCRSG